MSKLRSVESLESRCLLASSGWDGPGLGNAELTYYIGTIPTDIDADLVRDTIEQAFKVWSDVADIEFTPTNRRFLRDSIDISFGTIDGPGDTLAQAYPPDDVVFGRLAGDIEFDQDESWEVGNQQGNRASDLLWVAVHEIGHALGLEHNESFRSVMNSSVSPNTSFRSLAPTDVDAILELYAASPPVRGDFNNDGLVTVGDINLLNAQINQIDRNVSFDLTGDGKVDVADRDEMIENVLGTKYGDVNLDGKFNSTDLVTVFIAGRFERPTDTGTSKWQGGDWNGDGFFDTNDIVLAFQAGGFSID